MVVKKGVKFFQRLINSKSLRFGKYGQDKSLLLNTLNTSSGLKIPFFTVCKGFAGYNVKHFGMILTTRTRFNRKVYLKYTSSFLVVLGTCQR